MNPNLLNNMLTAHQEFLKKLDQEVEAIRKSQTPSADALKAKEQLLASERQRLESVKESKKQAIERFDAEVKRQTARLESLEKEIEEDRKSIQGGKKPELAPETQKAPTRKARKSKKAKR